MIMNKTPLAEVKQTKKVKPGVEVPKPVFEEVVYTSHKQVKPCPMNRLDYNLFRGWELPADEDGTDEGYVVMYTDGGKPNVEGYPGYISWSPKKQFDEGYTEITTSNEVSTPIERLLEEKKELDTKIKKLFVFTRGEMKGVSEAGTKLLIDQLAIMEPYSVILGKRIKLMGG